MRANWVGRLAALAAAAIVIVPLTAADTKVNLSKEKVGQPPQTFEPIDGKWTVVQDGSDKVIVVERGSIRFGLPGTGDPIELVAGDRLELPAGIAHDALVGSGGVSCLEAHLPSGSLSGCVRRPAGTW